MRGNGGPCRSLGAEDIGTNRGEQMRLDAGQIEVMDDAMAEVLRAKSGAERLRIVDNLARSARQLVAAGVRAQHPDWPQDQIDWETARRLSRGAF